jgi:hypothetical protein
MLSVVRDVTADPHTRLDAAKAAAPFVHPRIAQIEHRDPDVYVVPLHVRLKAYATRDAINESEGKVVEMKSGPKVNGDGLTNGAA